MKTLLIIDMQKGFIKGDSYFNINAKIEQLINNNNYDKLIFTRFINSSKDNPLYQEKIGWFGLTTEEEREFSIDIPQDSIIFEKYSYGLKDKDVEYLKSLNIKDIDICGVKSDACVYAISLQLWDRGIYPNILINYTHGDHDMKDIYIKQFGGVDNKK